LFGLRYFQADLAGRRRVFVAHLREATGNFFIRLRAVFTSSSFFAARKNLQRIG
jgi:hypothetical protein